jgi:hypothetical protein
MLINYPGEQFTSLESLRLNISNAREQQWKYGTWKPTHVLRNKKNGLRSFTLEPAFDTIHFELVSSSDHDHCDICWLTFSSSEGHLHAGHFNGESWICPSCHELFIDTPDPETAIQKFEKKED